MKATRAITTATLLCLFLSTPISAGIVTCHLETDEDLLDLLPEEEVAFVAEGRVGDRGGEATFELDLGQSASDPEIMAQYGWQNGVGEAFVLTYDASSGAVCFNLGGEMLFYSPGLAFSDVFIRARALNENTFIVVDDLVLDGEEVDDWSSAVGAGGLDILHIQGAQLSDGFTLTGNATLGWSGPPPTQSRLAFQIKLGVVEPPIATEKKSWGWVKSLFR